MGNENDGGPYSGDYLGLDCQVPDNRPYSMEWSRDHNRGVDQRRAAETDRDRWIRDTRDSKLSPEEKRRKAFLVNRDG